MTKPKPVPPSPSSDRKPAPVHPSPADDANAQRHKAEQSEVAGRHKNDGQKDHKGAR